MHHAQVVNAFYPLIFPSFSSPFSSPILSSSVLGPHLFLPSSVCFLPLIIHNSGPVFDEHYSDYHSFWKQNSTSVYHVYSNSYVLDVYISNGKGSRTNRSNLIR